VGVILFVIIAPLVNGRNRGRSKPCDRVALAAHAGLELVVRLSQNKTEGSLQAIPLLAFLKQG